MVLERSPPLTMEQQQQQYQRNHDVGQPIVSHSTRFYSGTPNPETSYAPDAPYRLTPKVSNNNELDNSSVYFPSLFGDEYGDDENALDTSRIIAGEFVSATNLETSRVNLLAEDQAIYLELEKPSYNHMVFNSAVGFFHVNPDWSKACLKLTLKNIGAARNILGTFPRWTASTAKCYMETKTASSNMWLLTDPKINALKDMYNKGSCLVKYIFFGEAHTTCAALVTFNKVVDKVKNIELMYRFRSNYPRSRNARELNTRPKLCVQPITEEVFRTRIFADLCMNFDNQYFVNGEDMSRAGAMAKDKATEDALNGAGANIMGRHFTLSLMEEHRGYKRFKIDLEDLFPGEFKDAVEEFLDIRCTSLLLLKTKESVNLKVLRELCLRKNIIIYCVASQEYHKLKTSSVCFNGGSRVNKISNFFKLKITLLTSADDVHSTYFSELASMNMYFDTTEHLFVLVFESRAGDINTKGQAKKYVERVLMDHGCSVKDVEALESLDEYNSYFRVTANRTLYKTWSTEPCAMESSAEFTCEHSRRHQPLYASPIEKISHVCRESISDLEGSVMHGEISCKGPVFSYLERRVVCNANVEYAGKDAYGQTTLKWKGVQEYKGIHDDEDLLSKENVWDTYERINKLEDERYLLRRCTSEDVGVDEWEEGPVYDGHRLYAEYPMVMMKDSKTRPVNVMPKAQRMQKSNDRLTGKLSALNSRMTNLGEKKLTLNDLFVKLYRPAQ